MRWALFAIAGLNTLAALASVARVGKERKPLTGGDAAAVVVVNAAIVVVTVLAGMQL